MKRKSFSANGKWSWLALSVALMAPTVVQATAKTAVEAKNCQSEKIPAHILSTCTKPTQRTKSRLMRP